MAQFKPMLIRTDREGLKIAQKRIDEKIELYNEGVEWASKHTEIRNVESFENDMVAEFKRSLLFKHEKNIGLPINADKMIGLLDIPIEELNRIAQKYYSIAVDIEVVNGIPTAQLDKDQFQLWTTCEEQNEKLRVARDFIKAVEHLSDYTKVYPFNMVNGTSGLVHFNARTQKFYPNI